MLNGRILNERYKIKQTIGGGGMANVYLARDIILERDVAIKVLRLEYANDDEFIARFHREAHSATSLSHPNIVNIYDVGEEEGIYYMVMEYVDGMTLKKYIQTYGPIAVDESITIMKQVTSAITHAHANDIVHRDIKPQNILIDSYGNVKVTDFGIAVALSATSLTQTNSVLGSVHYLSPEQARGGMANKKSDIYSLGIVLFELLTGRLPFSGQSAVSIALKHLQSETPSVKRWEPDIPQSVENIVLKSTTKDPFYRYETVHEMEEDLETALDPERLDEEKFQTPDENGEETKAIPIITEDTFQTKSTEETIVHDNTKNNGVKDKKSKKRKRNKTLIWVAISIFVLLGGVIAALFFIPGLLQPKDVELIDVSGMEYEEALSKLDDLNLEVERETMFSDEVPEGNVISTDPEAGTTVKEGSTVTVFTSDGKEKVTFDDYIGRDFSQVESLLEQSGYKNINAYEKFSDRPVGEIITQIQPQPDAEVVPDETNVIFEISKGPETVTLPSYQGMTESEARKAIEDEGLRVAVTEEHSEDVKEGNVIRQKPEPYSDVTLESEVEIFISTGPKEQPPVNHSVTFTVPYTGDESNADDEQQEEQPPEQEVRIYVGDLDRDITELFKEETITEDTEFTIKLTIPPGEDAEYRVMREDEVIIEKTVPYEDGEGD
ncbi:Stk1 family PASTA domain-containing Ser/Thr kinase [Sediminibacillus halophilus]|uniref:Serine/threonine-protein kinase PrkC n=1 Tax=Sediminibacillus halophilus TaxID=482461 RepID=A0A1G9MN83_9BACI|nr:Stk1 family PASTA domain-containing Ser/Thr kinase [Sediminibacillus halophilus]SDL75481.1 serine/threonine protein kinase [Sediminibacillus halophilus]